jgi:hypothetical protein
MIETYTLIKNVDDSILRLNDYLDGYQFVKIDLPTIEKNFSDIFRLPKDYRPTGIVSLNGLTYNREFYQHITHHELAGMQVRDQGYMILLKSNYVAEQNPVKDFELMGNTQRYSSHLIQCLRLTFSGDVIAPLIFQIERNHNQLTSSLSEKIPYITECLVIDDLKLDEFSNLLKKSFPQDAPYSLALENFNLSYSVVDKRVRFILLITALESIFNFGRDQISHTIARHLSLLISETKESFHENYSKVKKLYNNRSSLVHGSKKSIEDSEIDLAHKLSQKAICFWINKGCNQKKLFDYFNAKGYSDE